MSQEYGKLSRRAFVGEALRGVAALGLAAGAPAFLSREARGSDESSSRAVDMNPNEFEFARFRYQTKTRVQDEWDAHPDYDDMMLQFVKQNTNIRLSNRAWKDRVVMIDDFDRMRRTPFLFMTGEGDFTLSAEEAEVLGEYFKRGGFLYADDCVVDQKYDYFYQAFRREIKKVIPGLEMQTMPADHEIYHCVFDFPGKAPFMQGVANPDLGLFFENKLVTFLTSGDLHCGWTTEHFGASQCRESHKMATNIIVYALTH